jgi:hypothetical protein
VVNLVGGGCHDMIGGGRIKITKNRMFILKMVYPKNGLTVFLM